MISIRYSTLKTPNTAYYVLLGCFAFLALAGFWAFMTIHHHGHYVTGMNNQIVWGIPHVFAIFLIVAASGAANIATIATVFNRQPYQGLGRLSLFLAASLLVGGLVILLLDLGRMDHVIQMAKGALNFKSIFAWNMILYSGFIAIIAVYLWTMMDRTRIAKRLYKPLGLLNLTWRFLLTMGTGSIFGFLIARQYYDAAILAPLFIVASYVFGTAIYTLVLIVSFKISGRILNKLIIDRLRASLLLFIALLLFFETVRHLTNLYATEHHGVESFILLGDEFSSLFWWGQIVLGSLIPILFLCLPALKHNCLSLMAACSFLILGGLIQLYVLLIGGQSYPLVLFPNAETSSSFADGVINTYSASLIEYLLGLGGVGICFCLVFIGIKVLRLLPDHLDESSI